MGGEVDMLAEVKTLKEREEVRCVGGVWLVNMDVKVTGEKEAGETEDAMVRSSESSDRKEEWGLGGR